MVYVQRPGLARPGHRASSCRIDLSEAFFMPKNLKHPSEASHSSWFKAWPTEGRQCRCWEQACPLSTGCPNKNPSEETTEDSKLPKKKGRGRCLPKSHSLFLGEPGTQVQSRRSPSSLSGPDCPLHTKRGQRSGPNQKTPSCAFSSCHEVTQISHFSAPGLSFLMCWLRRHSACLLQRGLAVR